MDNPLFMPSNTFVRDDNFTFRSTMKSEESPPTLKVEDESPREGEICHHWFYRTDRVLGGDIRYWKPFTMCDSINIESAFSSSSEDPVSVIGGRYDVHLRERTLCPVYWESQEEKVPVLRASWFFREPAGHWIPFDESVTLLLEKAFLETESSNAWGAQRRIFLGETLGHVVFQSKDLLTYFPHSPSASLIDKWGHVQNQDSALSAPRVVHRGLDGLPDIPDGDSVEVDHLILVVHGIGKYCDIKLRDLSEVVSSFREKTGELTEKHFQSARLAGSANRIEFLPLTWHATLHGEDAGTDARLGPLTLKSVPKLRSFMNDTLMDILFYTSPVFSQTIINTVVSEANRVYSIFMQRNPGFTGGVSVMGHSLGSVIMFDILSHQKKASITPSMASPSTEFSQPLVDKDGKIDSVSDLFKKLEISSVYSDMFEAEDIDVQSLLTFTRNELKEIQLSDDSIEKIINYGQNLASPVQETLDDYNKKSVKSDVQYVVGPAGTGQLSVNYPQFNFNPSAFYALGSPIALFLAIRGISSLGESFSFPTCPEFYNIFHPYDPVAYRMEAMVNPEYSELRPVTVPHHMGRKRMHLELKDTVKKIMTMDIRKKIMLGMSYTLSSVYNLATGGSSNDETEIEKDMVDEFLRKEELRQKEDESNPKVIRSGLNAGNRIDFVLQEAPLESFNEYIFAIASHVSYWDSEDVCLMVLKNIYSRLNIRSDMDISLTDENPNFNNMDALSSSFVNSVPQQSPLSQSDFFPNIIQSPTNARTPSSIPPTLSSSPFVPESNLTVSDSLPVIPQIPMVTPASSMPSKEHFCGNEAVVSPSNVFPSATPVAPPPMASPSIFTQPSTRPLGYPKIYPRVPINSSQSTSSQMGMDPTAPLGENSGSIRPPPMGGFISKK